MGEYPVNKTPAKVITHLPPVLPIFLLTHPTMRPILALLLLTISAFAADAPFEILPGDRVLLLGDTLLERESTYGYLETRMHEQFADRPFTVRNLSWAGDTPLGLSRASFDPPAKGWERLKESIATVKPTVVFLGYGMAASLQQLTEESHDPTLNADPARYGAEPMTAARFKKEMGQLMDAIVESGGKGKGERPTSNVQRSTSNGGPGPGPDPGAAVPTSTLDVERWKLNVLPSPVRFVLLSPIRHEDLRAQRPGLPDPAAHNKLLAEYAKAIEELAKERGARFVDLFSAFGLGMVGGVNGRGESSFRTENGIHLNTDLGYPVLGNVVARALGLPLVFTEAGHLQEKVNAIIAQSKSKSADEQQISPEVAKLITEA